MFLFFSPRFVVWRREKKKYRFRNRRLKRETSNSWIGEGKSTLVVSVWAGEIVAASSSSSTARLGRRLVADSPLALCAHTQRSRRRETYRFVLVVKLPCSFTRLAVRSNGKGRLWLKTPGCATLWTNKVSLRRRSVAFSPIFFFFAFPCWMSWTFWIFFYCLRVTKSY